MVRLARLLGAHPEKPDRVGELARQHEHDWDFSRGRVQRHHFVQHGEVIWVNFAGIFTKTISQRLLLDGECSLAGAIVSLPETHKWLDSIYVPLAFFGWKVIDFDRLE